MSLYYFLQEAARLVSVHIKYSVSQDGGKEEMIILKHKQLRH